MQRYEVRTQGSYVIIVDKVSGGIEFEAEFFHEVVEEQAKNLRIILQEAYMDGYQDAESNYRLDPDNWE